ncbi:MAG TPA: pyrrolo-quinoline quinone [Terriglobales bacterium]|nr:pyrrolo-quinoline quinone [Terriglobales bacterium]
MRHMWYGIGAALGLAICIGFFLVSCSGGQHPNPTPAPMPPNPGSGQADVVTFHADVARTGLYSSEGTLTPANVNSAGFGKVGFFAVDGKVDAQPLLLSKLTLGNQGAHDVLYVVTEHDSAYAFDANSGATLWKVSLLGAGESPSDNHGCGQITPEIGITSTPVIDRAHNVIYMVAMSKDGSGNYFQRLHALNLTNGTELFGGPVSIAASFPGNGPNSSGGKLTFNPGQYAERAGLLLMNGVLYTAWTSHCDIQPYNGWIIAFNALSLGQTSVLNLTPNGVEGSIWMSGTAPAADSSGNIYFLDANGTFDTRLNASGFPALGDFGNAFLKISTTNGLAVNDYFATSDTVAQSNADNDLGSGGALVLPDMNDSSGQVKHLAVGAGKDGNIYVVDRDNMGKFDATTNHDYQTVSGVLAAAVFSMPAYFNGTIYYAAIGDALKAFTFTNALLSTSSASQSRNNFPYPGATPAVSAKGASNAIVWAHENNNPAVLHAYDATNLARELYNSNQAGSRDQFGPGNKFITPMIANGRVYVGTTNGVAVFGLLH